MFDNDYHGLYGGDCSVCNISGGGLYGRNLVVVCGLDR